MNLSRIHRLLNLIGLLQAGRGWNVESLAGACEVSRRTLFRDLNLLRQAGVPLSFDERQQTAARDDGTLDFRVTVSGINEISWWILGYGDEAEVLEPPALRRLVAERAARMAQRYRALP